MLGVFPSGAQHPEAHCALALQSAAHVVPVTVEETQTFPAQQATAEQSSFACAHAVAQYVAGAQTADGWSVSSAQHPDAQSDPRKQSSAQVPTMGIVTSCTHVVPLQHPLLSCEHE